MMERIVINVDTVTLRRVSRDGKPYLVAPATLIVPGVLEGSRGKLYYPPDECAKDPAAWNGMPITAYHPLNGGPAKTVPGQHIGDIQNAIYNGKLRAEAWFDEKRTEEVDPRITQALKMGFPLELSTGLHTENEEKKGEHNGRPYDAIARNYKPDHVAVLPDQVGACSINDGCGVLVNRKSILERAFDMVRNAIGGQPRHGDTGKYLAHGAGSGKGPVHAAAASAADTCPECNGRMVENVCENCGYTANAKDAKGHGHTTNDFHMESYEGQMLDPHQASHDAASASVRSEHGPSRDKAIEAVDASKNGDHAAAADAHIAAAKIHEKAATKARSDKEPANGHDDAAALHRKAASMHAATKNAKDALGHGSDKRGEGSGGAKHLSGRAEAATERAEDEEGYKGDAHSHKLQLKAAAAHEAASSAHEKEGNKDEAKYHKDMAEGHRSTAKDIKGMSANRNELIDALAANCKCERAEFELLSDKTLQALNAKKKEKDEEDDDDEGDDAYNDGEGDRFDLETPKKGSKVQSGGKGTPDEYNENAWLKAAPPRVRETVQHAMRISDREKRAIVDKLTVNLDGKKAATMKEKLLRKPLEELYDLLQLAPAQTSVENEDRQPIYFGDAPPTVNREPAVDKDAILVAPKPDWKEWSKSAV